MTQINHYILSPYCIHWFLRILQYEVYQDPDKGKVCVDSVITLTPIAFIFARYSLFSMFY